MDTATTHEMAASARRRFLAWYLETPIAEKSLIRWWELRRIAYNLVLLAWGALNILIWVPVIAAKTRSTSSILVWSTALYSIGVVALILQISANFWYTGGWVAGLAVRLCAGGRALGFNRYALLIGTLFSLAFSECCYCLIALE